MVFAKLITPVSRKTIVFRIKLLTFANGEQKSANNNQPHTDLYSPRPPRTGRSADSEIAPKKFRSWCSQVQILVSLDSKISVSKLKD